MGCSLGCCVKYSFPDHVSPDDPSLSAYALTTNYVRHTPGGSTHLFNSPTVPKAVYVRDDMLRLDVSNCWIVCITGTELDGGGYPVCNISSVEVVKENQVKISGSDGTRIAFITQHPEQFVSALEAVRYSVGHF